MYWWQHFDRSLLGDDLFRIQETGSRVVRIFLLWEDFQPRAKKVSTLCLDNLVEVAEQADRRGLMVLPTFFTGHMSGVNYLPPWTLWAKETELRYPTFSLGKTRPNLPRSPYEDPEILEAQALLVREVSGALKGHPALHAWDLGNSPSCVAIPPDRQSACLWLRVMTEELRARDETIPITLGMNEQDLWENPVWRSQAAAEHLDFLSMQAYPFCSELPSDPLDSYLPPFLGILSRWLGGKEVLLIGFGVPTSPVLKPDRVTEPLVTDGLVSEEQAGEFFRSVLNRLLEAGITGAVASYFSDYPPGLWKIPPLDTEVRERHMGIYRHDGSPKDLLPILRPFGSVQRRPLPEEPPSWIDLSREEYNEDPEQHIRRLYKNYREHCGPHPA
jgi:endo-1,4-beta-mannosidase